MKTLALLFALFTLPTAQAEATGSWLGWGEWTFQGQGTDCPTMRISYEESATELKRLGGVFDCGIVVLHSDPLRWERKGNELFLAGVPAGSIRENRFTTVEPYNDEGTMVHTSFTREGNHAD